MLVKNPTAPKFLDKLETCFKFIADRGDDPNCVMYVEHGSKSWCGGLSDFRQEIKEVSCYAVTGNVPKCLVFLLNLYNYEEATQICF